MSDARGSIGRADQGTVQTKESLFAPFYGRETVG